MMAIPITPTQTIESRRTVRKASVSKMVINFQFRATGSVQPLRRITASKNVKEYASPDGLIDAMK